MMRLGYIIREWFLLNPSNRRMVTANRMPANGKKNLRLGGGRSKGSGNVATPDIRERARQLVEDPVYCLRVKERILEGNVPLEIMLHHYAYGKPRETVALEGSVTISVVKPW